jgi:hypothetical protein
MKIDRVTFTGVDDNTNIKDLELISSQNPYVEWGILYSEKQQGQGGKYPSKKTILKVLVHDGALKKYNTSLHLCGNVARDFITKEIESYVTRMSFTIELPYLMMFCDRIQLNFSASRNKPDLFNFLPNVKKYKKPIILQIHSGNLDFINSISKYTKDEFHYLFDASGGNGIEIQDIPLPSDYGLKDKYCAFAGGLSPDNLEEKLKLINASLPEDSIIGIDMETGIRTDGKFDIEKVKRCVEIINKLNY